MTKLINLTAVIPQNRNLEGVLKIQIDGKLVKQMRVLARGSTGAGDTQFKENGNTPTGTYDGSTFIRSTHFDHKSYGPWGKVLLKPLNRNALLAEDIFKRKNLLIHSGALSTKQPWKGNLKPTNGCLRLLNEDMKFLLDLLQRERQMVLLSNTGLQCDNDSVKDSALNVLVTVTN